ncbi:MAG: hypothetical protein ABIR79_13045, partial [Candidatus Binatia bacterium]
AVIVCRDGVNGDGTVTDDDTGLQWEQKTDDGSVHDFTNDFTWSPNDGPPDGTVFTSFLGTLNDGRSPTALAAPAVSPATAIVELRTIVDPHAPGCGQGVACIDQTVFGPTIPFLLLVGHQ